MIINEPRRTLTQELTATFRLITAATLAVLATIAAVGAWFFVMILPRMDNASHLVAVADAAGQSLQQEQSSLRSFTLTGDPGVLSTYRLGRDRLALQNRALAASPSSAVRAADHRFAALSDGWTQSWVRRALDPTRPAVTTRHGDLASHRLIHFLDAGAVGYQAAFDGQQQLMAAAVAHQQAVRGQAIALLSAGGALVLLTAAGVLAVTRRRRNRLEGQIVGPIQALLVTLRSVGRGEFGRNPPRAGPAELVGLRDEMVDMSASLQLQQRALAVRAEQAAHSAQRLEQIVEFAREVSGSLTMGHVLRAFAATSRRVLHSPRARIWVLDPEGRTLRLEHDSRPSAGIHQVVHAIDGPGVGRAARERRVCYLRGLTGEPAQDGGAVALALPLRKGQTVVGVLEVVLTPETHRLRADTLDVLEAISGQAATAIDAAMLYSRVESLSLSDPLTGLANRRRFDQDINLEVERCRRSGQALTVLMVDVDYFKRVNDTLGHSAGDAVLREIGETLQEQMRTGDTAYRIGGEEFAVLLRDTDRAGAEVVAERVRALVQQRYTPGTGPHVTVSVGVASLPADGAASVTDLVDAADAAMYGAKRSGRNKVVVSDVAIPAQRDTTERGPIAALPS